ncbi:MAG: hypothetical protein AABZ64_01375 [Nitrospinota bacterium]
METSLGITAGKSIERVWRCPSCGRIFRGHVFDHGTPASGPMCNACCAELEWAEVEREAREAPLAATGHPAHR